MTRSANEILAGVYDTHTRVDAPLDVHTTGGIQRTLKMHAEAIQALADKIDGKDPEADRRAEEEKDRKEQERAANENKFKPEPAL